MSYRIGNTKHLKTIGRTEETECPVCNTAVQMQVYSNPDYQFVLRFPPVEKTDVCFAVCPHCAAVHQITVENVETRRTKQNGKETIITEFQLGALKSFE